ncbi:MAG: amino acid ABC transporter permease [Leptolyngbya foveolarum]|uniref:Amino acid ABC transporter permease n=1 Tax=Leptolyngbya foveolarum TaxID=47253 RepID=A0A2W4U6X2_9CYAN|nr:MAG: amino acid ABC transporter permease [Leptolyngbya foveolarum]
MIAALAGVSWGVLARNQKQLFSRNVLIGLGAVALLFIIWPMTQPHLAWILGSMVLLVAGAALGKAFGLKVNGAATWVSGMWFLSYLIALYLFGGGPFFGKAPVVGPSIFYRAVTFGLPLWTGWQLAKRIDVPGIPKLLGDIILFIVGFIVPFQLLRYIPYWLGLDFGLKSISSSSWGGLSLTLLLAISGIALCFPAGVLLALGRRSKLPVVRGFSVAYIELIRGVPLISILFMGQVLIPLFLPEGVRPDRVVRAIIGLTIFSAAYLAENVRAGLQSISQGQTEAAQSLGLNKPLTTALIVLPQALKIAIPAIVGQFISLFQDTTLLGIVGLIELLGITQSLSANPKYLGDYAQAYLFIATIYWIFCYAMSYGSQRIEESLNTDLR